MTSPYLSPDMLIASAEHERHVMCGAHPLACRSCLTCLAGMIAERLAFDHRDAAKHPLDWYQEIAWCDVVTAIHLRQRTVESCKLPTVDLDDLDNYPPHTFTGSIVFALCFFAAAAVAGWCRLKRSARCVSRREIAKEGVTLALLLLFAAEITVGLYVLVGNQ